MIDGKQIVYKNQLRRRRNYLCMHRFLDKSTSFSFSSRYQILILWPYQPYGVLLDHSDSLMSEAILLLSSGRVVSVIHPSLPYQPGIR